MGEGCATNLDYLVLADVAAYATFYFSLLLENSELVACDCQLSIVSQYRGKICQERGSLYVCMYMYIRESSRQASWK